MISLILSLLALALFTALLVTGQIGEASYCFLVAASALFGLVLHGFARLQEFDLKNLRIVLRELQEAKKDIVVHEERLKGIALPLLQAIAFNGAAEGRMGSTESFAAKRRWYKQKVTALTEALNLTASEAAEARKYIEKYEEVDAALEELHSTRAPDPKHAAALTKVEILTAELNRMLIADASK